MSLLLLLACSACVSDGHDAARRGVHLCVDEPDQELLAPVVMLDDGTRFLESHVFARAEPGESLEIDAWIEPGEPEPGSRIVIKLYRAGGTSPVMTRTLKATWPPEGTLPGERVRLHGRIKLPKKLKPGDHWLTWEVRDASDEQVGAPGLPSGRVSLGTVQISGDPLPEPPGSWAVPEGPILVAGGDLMLGRRMNGIVGLRGMERPLVRVPELKDADLALANLECVVAAGGERKVDQGEPVPYYYRGRPETLGVLTVAGIDVVQTANNHGGDYGPSATMEQLELLEATGISGVGTGADRSAACAPIYRRAGDLVVAIFGMDLTTPEHQATETVPGSCYYDPDDVDAFLAEVTPQVTAARRHADIVLFGVHWALRVANRPRDWERAMARAMIAAGADAVVGNSAHGPRGVEIIDGRPVIHDTGDLLFDSWESAGKVTGMLARLHLGPGGVARDEGIPLSLGWGSTRTATGNKAARALLRYRDLSQELGTRVRFQGERAIIDLPRPPDRSPPTEPPPVLLAAGTAPGPETHPPDGCRVDSVPQAARVEPQDFGPVRLLGVRLTPDELTGRRVVWSETWWTATEPVDKDYWIHERLVPTEAPAAVMWWADHEHCDWMWPSSRWEPGAIYKDLYALRPQKSLPADTYRLRLGLSYQTKRVGARVDYPGVTVLPSDEPARSPSPASSSPQTR